MEILEQINLAIDYIENNINDPLPMEAVAKSAYLSSYYFQRIFHALTGFTVAEYIRNRRLTLAAQKLMDQDSTVINVALEYGYDSVDAFSRAFQRLHGVTPTAVRKGNVTIKAFSRISLQINMTGRVEMKYRIVKQDGYDMVGLMMQTSSPEKIKKEVAEFCEKVWDDGTHQRLNEFLGFPRMHMLDGVHIFRDDEAHSYLLGWKAPAKEIPVGYQIIHIPENEWTVFEFQADMTDKAAINQLWEQIYVEWLPSAKFEQIEGPCIEKFQWKDDQYFEYQCEIWIPVQRKQEKNENQSTECRSGSVRE